MVFIYWFLITFASPHSSAQTCVELFHIQKNHSHQFNQQLSAVPQLRELVTLLMNEPDVPEVLKKLLVDVILNPQVRIYDFPETLKEKYQFPQQIAAFVGSLNLAFRVRPRSTGNLNDQSASSFAQFIENTPGSSQYRFHVLIKDGPFTQSDHPLLFLIHELAHIQLILFFEKHISQLAGKVPPDFLSQDPATGEWIIDSHFYSYIHERYAHEMEFLAFKSILNKQGLLKYPPSKWSGTSVYSAESEYFKARLAQIIRHNYRLNDDRLIFFDKRSVTEILTDGLEPHLWWFGQH